MKHTAFACYLLLAQNARLQQDLDEAHEQADKAVKERRQLYDDLSEASQVLYIYDVNYEYVLLMNYIYCQCFCPCT